MIVWINRPYKAGDWVDLNFPRNSLKSHLEYGERVEVDDVYLGEAPEFTKRPVSFTNSKRKHKTKKQPTKRT